MNYWIPTLCMVTLAACTSVEVKPVERGVAMNRVCIHKNPAVAGDDFVLAMDDGFQRHRIAVEVYEGDLPASCEYVVDYTVWHSWDLTPYLSQAEISVTENGHLIASATYHLKGNGGLDLSKWRSTRSKMEPVMDELLAEFRSHGEVEAGAEK